MPADESDEIKQAYIQQVREASILVRLVLDQHPEHDVSDLFHIALSLKESPEERLRRGLRRRTISGFDRQQSA